MTGNSCFKRLVVFWSCRSADVVACADCPQPTCRATGCKICEKPRLFHWKVGMAALRKGGWDCNRKKCFKICFIFSSSKWFMGLNHRNLAKSTQFPLQNHVSSIFWTSQPRWHMFLNLSQPYRMQMLQEKHLRRSNLDVGGPTICS